MTIFPFPGYSNVIREAEREACRLRGEEILKDLITALERMAKNTATKPVIREVGNQQKPRLLNRGKL